VRIYGIDFTCAPRAAKAITVAAGSLKKNCLAIENVERLESFTAFEAFLARPGPWVGGFDFPFSLPRELVATSAGRRHGERWWRIVLPLLACNCALHSTLTAIHASLEASTRTG
jgi:hypothetical protein